MLYSWITQHISACLFWYPYSWNLHYLTNSSKTLHLNIVKYRANTRQQKKKKKETRWQWIAMLSAGQSWGPPVNRPRYTHSCPGSPLQPTLTSRHTISSYCSPGKHIWLFFPWPWVVLPCTSLLQSVSMYSEPTHCSLTSNRVATPHPSLKASDSSHWVFSEILFPPFMLN